MKEQLLRKINKYIELEAEIKKDISTRFTSM